MSLAKSPQIQEAAARGRAPNFPTEFVFSASTDGARGEENKELSEVADGRARRVVHRLRPKSDSANGPDAEEEEEEDL